VQFHWETTLSWQFFVKNKAGEWVPSLGYTDGGFGASVKWETKHRSLCVANQAPIVPQFTLDQDITADNQAWEKVMQYSCDWAKDKAGSSQAEQQEIVEALWSGIDQQDTSSTGARHDIKYTFQNLSQSQSVRGFLLDGCRGPCGRQAKFFIHCAAAQGISVDLRAIQTYDELPGDAGPFAVNSADVDGDWAEQQLQTPLGPPQQGGNTPWWYTYFPGDGTLHIGTHGFCSFGGTIYDPSFGTKQSASWQSYVAGAISHYGIKTQNNTFVWYAKNEIQPGGFWVKMIQVKNDNVQAPEFALWPEFP
jgi:hypothetical protein